jgi:hypothetical protein
MMNRTSETVSRERQLLALVCKGMDDKKAEDLRIIDVRGLSSITDYIVIATGLAEPHLRAMRIEVEKCWMPRARDRRHGQEPAERMAGRRCVPDHGPSVYGRGAVALRAGAALAGWA